MESRFWYEPSLVPVTIHAVLLMSSTMQGTFITEWGESKPDALYLLDGQPGESRFFFADKMIAMAKYYGFDGWFFNIECGLDSPENSRRMASFIEYMKTATRRELGDGALVIWYDSVTSEGVLKYVIFSSLAAVLLFTIFLYVVTTQ